MPPIVCVTSKYRSGKWVGHQKQISAEKVPSDWIVATLSSCQQNHASGSSQQRNGQMISLLARIASLSACSGSVLSVAASSVAGEDSIAAGAAGALSARAIAPSSNCGAAAPSG